MNRQEPKTVAQILLELYALERTKAEDRLNKARTIDEKIIETEILAHIDKITRNLRGGK